MAFFRFSRDKRGYEHFYLVEPVTNRKGKSRPRVLYWYRTPPNVRVGRVPFDDEVRRALEARYPNVAFDWTKIVEAPIPSADVEKWRERRRAERSERAARRSDPTEAADEESAADEADVNIAESAADAEPTSTGSNARQSEAPTADAAARKRRRRRRDGDRVPSQATPGSPPSDSAAPTDLSDSSGITESTDSGESADTDESADEIADPPGE